MKNVDILICLLAIYIIKLSVGSQIKYYTELQMGNSYVPNPL
jgi:hypothetical protein